MKKGVIRFVEHSENDISLRISTIKSVPVNFPDQFYPGLYKKLEQIF